MRDELEHLLDDNEDMADLYLTRKWIQNQQNEALLGAAASNNLITPAPYLPRLSSHRSVSLATSNFVDDDDVEDLEMLLEAYFMQLDGTRNKILSVSITIIDYSMSLVKVTDEDKPYFASCCSTLKSSLNWQIIWITYMFYFMLELISSSFILISFLSFFIAKN